MSARLLSTAEAADVLGCPRHHVTRLIRRRDLLAVDISSGPGRPTWRIKPSDLDDYVTARTTQPISIRRTA